MKINIAATHRFHLLDLARELSGLGHEVRFYSYVPTKRVMSFGLEKRCCYSILWVVAPFFFLKKLFPQANWTTKWQNITMDYYLSWFMKPCDIYIALGTVYKHSLTAAKNRFDAIAILEWGSKHIDEQQRILASIGVYVNKEYYNKRSRDGYALADYIAIPSEHVKQSFMERGIAKSKLLQNPYGTSLKQFHPTSKPAPDAYDVIMVGGWSYRKGCDLLAKTCLEILNIKLLHVGSVVDCPLPQHPLFTHIDSVEQKQLVNYYAQARVFALASHEEGLAMVQAQALACGLPIVCSKDSGGRDLADFLADKNWIIEMPETTTECLADCIKKALLLAKKQPEGLRNYAGKSIEQLTWSAYGKRYNENLNKIIE